MTLVTGQHKNNPKKIISLLIEITLDRNKK